MNSIDFEKEVKKGNTNIYFDLEVTENKLDKIPLTYIFAEKNFGTNINELIYYIRVVFRDYTEQTLKVKMEDTKCKKYVKFVNKEVEKYEYKEKLNDVTVNFTYGPEGINLNIDNESSKKNIENEKINNILTECLNNVKELNNIKNINIYEFTKEEKILIEIYRLFFNESPDFSKKEDINKAQSMMWLLYKEGIYLPEEEGFTIRHTGKVWSFNIESIIDRLIPYGKINDSFDDIKLKKEAYNTIISMGQIIRRYIENKEEKTLENISKISYIIDRCIPVIYDVENIIETGYVDSNVDVFDINMFLSNLEISLKDDKPVEKYNEISEEQKRLKLSIK